MSIIDRYQELRAREHSRVREELADQFGDDNDIDISEDKIAWRRALRKNPGTHLAYRAAVAIAGLVLIIVGLPMIPLVGPGWVLVILGVFLWATEFRWARSLLQLVKAEVSAFHHWMSEQSWGLRIGLGLLAAIFAWGCMWWAFTLTGVPSWLTSPIDGWLDKLPGVDPAT